MASGSHWTEMRYMLISKFHKFNNNHLYFINYLFHFTRFLSWSRPYCTHQSFLLGLSFFVRKLYFLFDGLIMYKRADISRVAYYFFERGTKIISVMTELSVRSFHMANHSIWHFLYSAAIQFSSIYSQYPPFGAKIYTDIYPRTLPVLRWEQFCKERSSTKTASFEEQIVSKNNYTRLLCILFFKYFSTRRKKCK